MQLCWSGTACNPILSIYSLSSVILCTCMCNTLQVWEGVQETRNMGWIFYTAGQCRGFWLQCQFQCAAIMMYTVYNTHPIPEHALLFAVVPAVWPMQQNLRTSGSTCTKTYPEADCMTRVILNFLIRSHSIQPAVSYNCDCLWASACSMRHPHFQCTIVKLNWAGRTNWAAWGWMLHNIMFAGRDGRLNWLTNQFL